MKTIKISTAIGLIFILSSCNWRGEKKNQGQNLGEENPVENFLIGNYMIVPAKKEIRKYTMVGGVSWDGFEYQKDSTINFETTTLLALGSTILVKEDFPFPYNLDHLKIIYKDEFYFLSKDENYIYYTSSTIKPTRISIAEYDAVNDFIYKSKKSGKLFFINIESYTLSPVSLAIDEKTIQHLEGNFYSDKNSLYFFGAHSKKNKAGYYDDYVDQSEQLIDAKNGIIKATKKYIIFNKQFYAVANANIKKLEIDTDKMIEVTFESGESFISDGKTIFSDMNYGYDDDSRNENGYYGIWYPTLYAGVNLQKIYAPKLSFMRADNTVVFNKNDPNNFPGLIAVIDNESYLLTDKKKLKINKMLFYNPEKKTTEVFDEKFLKIFEAERFILYKDVLYFDGMPVQSTKLNFANLREIKDSNYLTDGKALFYIGTITGYGSPTIDGIDYATFDDRIIENAYNKDMAVVNPDLLTDGITLVSKEQKIKIKDLKLNVKVIK